MEDLISTIFAACSKCNPVYGVIALAVWYVFGGKIKSLLARIPLPKLVGPAPADPKTDLDAWLEQHPLLDRIWVRLKDQFGSAIADGKLSEDDAYIQILNALKSALK